MLKLFKHQSELVALNPKNYLFTWEPGCGKTIGALSLCEKNSQIPLIICPRGLVDMWKETLKTFFPLMKYTLYSKETFRRDWRIIPRHYTVVGDEIHYFFGTKSKMMKSLASYLKLHDVHHKYFLSATPFRSSPWDAFVCSSLMGKPLNYWTFQQKFFYMLQMGHRLIPRPRKGIEKEVAEIFNQFGTPVKLKDCIDMPEALYKEEYFGLTKAQKEAISTLDEPLAVVKYGKIHQICGGTLKSDGYSETKTYDSEKKDRILEFANNVDHLIVVCRYNQEIDYLKTELEKAGHYVRFINGSVENRHELLKELETKERYILLVNAKCSEGWENVSCSHMIFYSYDWELKNKIQMEGRIRRINNPRPVLYTSLICKDTIDQDVHESLAKKMDFHIAVYVDSVLK